MDSKDENSLKYYSDLKNSLDTARGEGKIEGKLEGKLEIAKRALKKGYSINDITEITGLSEDEIKGINQ